MRRIDFCQGWLFNYGLPKHCGPFITNKEVRVKIDLPHDFLISTDVQPDAPSEGDSGFYVGNSGYYSKTFDMADVSGTTILSFDGVYQNAYIRVNKSAVFAHSYGYTPFFADISKYLVRGKNTIDVEVSTLPEPNCRWYSGGGIYRPVTMLRAGDRYIAPNGIYVRYKFNNEDADLTISVRLNGPEHDNEQLKITVVDPSGKVAAEQFVVSHGSEITEAMSLTNIQRWDVESPALYTVQCELISGDELLDHDEVQIGMREVSFTPTEGMKLNGKSIKLKGGNCHHLIGILGAASFEDAERRKMQKMKDSGFNAVRFAHNPPSATILKCCDEIGLLVINEIFDMWLSSKKEYDYHMAFENNWRDDVRNTLERDRNHPSIIIWSIGNEIQDPFEVGGYDRAAEITAEIRQLDPDRWVTLGGIVSNPMSQEDRDQVENYLRQFNHIAEEKITRIGKSPVPFPVTKEDLDITEQIVDMIDIHYEYVRYESLAKERPNSMIIETETMGSEIDLAWDALMRTPQAIGDFSWPCWDYIGEAGNGYCRYLTPEEAKAASLVDDSEGTHPQNFPHRTFGDGEFDMCGRETPMNHFRQVVWTGTTTELFVLPPKLTALEEVQSPFAWPHVIDYWTYPGDEGKLARVEVYSAAESVELFLNGESLGVQPAGKMQRYRAIYNVPYRPGELLAVSYQAGKETSRKSLKTIGAPAEIRMKPETTNPTASIKSICYVDVEVTDDQGNVVQTAEIPMKASVTGAGYLLAFGSAHSSTAENYAAGCFTSKNGRLQAVIRSNGQPGDAILTATAEGYSPATCTIHFE